MKRTMMLVVLAVAALGVLPAAASAKTVLVDESGKVLPVGADVYGTSSSFGMDSAWGSAYCESVNLGGKVGASGSGSAVFSVSSTVPTGCQTLSGSAFVFSAMSIGSLSFLDDGSATIDASDVWKWTIYSGSVPVGSCSGAVSDAAAAWGEYVEYEAGLSAGVCGDWVTGGQFILSADVAGNNPVYVEVR